jgi:hypothetical protein
MKSTTKQDEASEKNVPLPHETDQNADSQSEHEPREVGKQAHEDVKRGIVDTDRRGGGEYQEDTQRDDHANVNSDKRKGSGS